MASKTQKAVNYFNQNKGLYSQADVAKKFDISRGAISRALKTLRQTASRRCPCCKQVINKAFVGIK